MSSEHARRHLMRKHRRREFELLRSMSNLRENAEFFLAEIRQRGKENRLKGKAIRGLEATLVAHGIPVLPAMLSFHLCTGDDSECPLGLHPIDSCPPPFEGCLEVIDPLYPDRRCAELPCKHRFNAVWLLFHFVRNQTSCCPVCRTGRKRFVFGAGTAPEWMLEAVRQSRCI